MSCSPNRRTTIDQKVYKWVVLQKDKDKVVTANTIRQKAIELGQEFLPHFKASLNWYNNWKKRYDYTETAEVKALKHKNPHYTAAFQLHAVRRAAEMESASQAALELDVSRRSLERWTQEVDVITSVAEHSSNAVYRRPAQGRKVFNASLDKDLLEWVKECWKRGDGITACIIREKAMEMGKCPGFKASLGWYINWQKRHGIDLKLKSYNPPSDVTICPLKLDQLQEGEVYTYTPGIPSAKRRKTNRKKMSYDDEALLENDEEFDRQLLTWLVEHWKAGDIITDRMVKDRAVELSTNAKFKPSKVWLLALKRKYNIILENQTYGNEGEEEVKELGEEIEICDGNEVLLDEQQLACLGGNSKEMGFSLKQTEEATIEEAARVLASLSAEDYEKAGLEIAEFLQKQANKYGIGQERQEVAKVAMAQLTAPYQADNNSFILGGCEDRVGVEEIISKVVITDDPMVVIETEVPESEMVSEVTEGELVSELAPASHIMSKEVSTNIEVCSDGSMGGEDIVEYVGSESLISAETEESVSADGVVI